MLDWRENLSEDEMPPEWMWPLDDEVVIWIERVVDERNSRYGKDSNSDDESAPMMSNELARGRR